MEKGQGITKEDGGGIAGSRYCVNRNSCSARHEKKEKNVGKRRDADPASFSFASSPLRRHPPLHSAKNRSCDGEMAENRMKGRKKETRRRDKRKRRREEWQEEQYM